MFELTTLGVVEAVAKHHAVDVIGQKCLYIASHIVGVGLAGLRANIKWSDTLVAMRRKSRLDALGMIFGLMQRPAADWY